jgi:hypothetical protein
MQAFKAANPGCALADFVRYGWFEGGVGMPRV